MSNVIIILWTILLVVSVLLIPLIVSLLHRTWVASRSIQRYFKEMKEAGLGIAKNTNYINTLDDTIDVASGILEVAGEIDKNANIIKGSLSDRAAKIK